MEFIKQMNRDLVLDTIRNKQPISRADIARALNMSRSTVSSIVDELLSKKFVEEVGIGTPSKEGGKPTIQLGFNPKSGYGVGVDVGGTKVWIEITDLDGNSVYHEKVATSSDLSVIYQKVADAIGRSGIDSSKVLAVGFGVPGLTDSARGLIVDAPALQWTNKEFVKPLEALFGLPVFVVNDVNAAALGEQWRGAARHVDDMVFIAIGTGVGSAIIAGGNLILGHGNMSGEIGYLLGYEDVKLGRKNEVGKFGIFESKTSGTWLDGHDPFSSVSIFEEFAKGNEAAAAIIEEFVGNLCVGIANVVSLLNPEKVILGGGVSQSLQPLLEQIRLRVAEFTPLKTQVDLSGLGEKAGAVGAVAYAFGQLRERT